MKRRSRRAEPITLSAAIFAVAFIVRLIPLGLYVTPDEPIWVQRSHELLQAVETADLTAIPQTGHPGMTTMALGALGIWLSERANPTETAVQRDWIDRIASLAPENGAAFPYLVALLPAGRILVACVTSAGLALVHVVVRRRVSDRIARLAVLCLALDPFLAGHSGLLHTDGLQATFVLLAVACSLPARHRATDTAIREWFPSVVATAAFLALAGLTKMLGLLAAPGLALALFLWWKGPVHVRIARVITLALLTAAFLVVLYPPLWFSPREALASLIGTVTYHEGIGLRPVFFAGETGTDPGVWFYPVVLLFRLTPPVLVGLLFWIGCCRDSHFSRFRLLIWALLPALSTLIGITTGEKKFDRYVLTLIPLLTLVAATTWSHRRRRMRTAVLASLALPWALVALLPLQYANPMLGGPWIAQRVVPLGWGEASGLAARWLNRRAEGTSVMTGNVPGTAGLFAGSTFAWDETRLGCTDFLIGGDSPLPGQYAILAELRSGGRVQSRVYGHVQTTESRGPFVAPGSLPGLPATAGAPATDFSTLWVWLTQQASEGSFYWIHAPQCHPLTEAQLRRALDEAVDKGSLDCEADAPFFGWEVEKCTVLADLPQASPYLARFGIGLDLLAATWDDLTQPSDPLTVRLRWWAQVPQEEVEVYLALRGDGDEVIWAEGGRRLLSDWGWAAPDWPVEAAVDTEAYIVLPPHLPPGAYRLVLRVSGPQGMLGIGRADGSFGGTELALGVVEVGPARRQAADLTLDKPADSDWPGLRVVATGLGTMRVQTGQRLPFSLGIERLEGELPEGLHWDLLCGGISRDSGTLPLPARAADLWATGARYVLRFAPRLAPTTIAAALEETCSFSVRPVSGDPTVPSTAREVVILGELVITQRFRTYTLSHQLTVSSSLTVDGIGSLLGADVSPVSLGPGDAVGVTLYWRVSGDVARDYTIFVHAVGPDGRVWGQSDTWPAQGYAPTTTWVVGEIIADEHVLMLDAGAPSGTYRLYVGLYDARDGLRAALYLKDERVPEDRALLSTVDVQASL